MGAGLLNVLISALRAGRRLGTPKIRLAALAVVCMPAVAQDPRLMSDLEMTPAMKLGERIFNDVRFSNPGSQFSSSCKSCHIPGRDHNGERAFSDSLPLSLIPSNANGRKQTTRRNTPSLINVSKAKRFNHDGRYGSLEALLRAKLFGTDLGWLPRDKDRVLDELSATLFNDQGDNQGENGTYPEQFMAAMDVELAEASNEERLGHVVAALAAYLATLDAAYSSPYDAFAFLNRIGAGLEGEGDTPQAYSGRIFGRLANQEGRAEVKFPKGFTEEAYQGYKQFIRLDGSQNAGGCVQCHPPPDFTDNAFHNTGVAQEEYDGLHGSGSFARLSAPPGNKGSEATRSRPAADDKAKADLGAWNYSDEMKGAFKTPGLRNLDRTDPYMHNGRYATLEDVLAQKIRACAAARGGNDPHIDPAFKNVFVSEDAIPNLVAFLRTITELGVANYRALVVRGVKIRP